MTISEILKSASGQYISRLPESEIWVENVCGGQTYKGKSQFSLNANSSEIDG